MIPEIHIEDFDYALPDERIAKFPKTHRDQSKLLACRNGQISEQGFSKLPELLPQNALMIFNDTKVVPARLDFVRETGAHIEIFCLEPHNPVEYNTNFAAVGHCSWKCIVGNVKKWKNDTLHLYNPAQTEQITALGLCANLIQRNGETSFVEFTWGQDIPFSKVLEIAGNIPIPPYLNRDTQEVDKERYQTLYAKYRGSVAAPTAGLHFTQEVLEAIKAKGIDTQTVCLHVGAGTFLPVKSSLVSEHTMHREPFTVSKDLIEKLLERVKLPNKSEQAPIVAVGTTSVRTLESLYYAGVKCILKGKPDDIAQWEPYEGAAAEQIYSTEQAFVALLNYLNDNGLDSLTLGTKIIIVPGYEFRVVDILVTNFHQPQSTLLLLISAFLKGAWKPVYNYALSHDFRFLSYGDSSLLFRSI